METDALTQRDLSKAVSQDDDASQFQKVIQQESWNDL